MITKLTKPKKKSKTYYQNKADKLFQDLGRSLYKSCLVCGGEYSCLHHFFKKSQSTALRYNLKNAIPLCNTCHCAIHQGTWDKVSARIALIKGKDWLDELEALQRAGRGLNYGVAWYQDQYNNLKNI